MAIPRFDRTLLGPHGQEFSDSDYAQIVAALGLWWFSAPSRGEPVWSATPLYMELGWPTVTSSVQQLQAQRARWGELRHSLTRLTLDSESDWGKAFEQATVLAILNHPA